MTNKKSSEPAYKVKGVDLLFLQKNETPLESVLLSAIHLPSKQPRRYFDLEAMEALTASIRQKGVLQPLLVRPKGQNQYELVAGERRYRAAKEARLETVPVIIKDFSDEETFEIALVENLQREDLNPLEETEGILDLLSLKLNQSREAVISLFHVVSHPERESANNVIHSDEWKVVLDVFNIIGKFTPNSFRTNRLPLLNLPKDILEYLRQGKIEYTKAREIARIKNNSQREELLTVAITEKLSLNQIKERIASIKTAVTKTTSEKSALYQSRLKAISTKAKKTKVWDDSKKTQKFDKLLAEIEKLLAEE
ncbi:ParB/RepB/Spo0J family partition protein [Nostoc sp. FACHB-892]|uniref:ParB/RepB/Spo0J family partition protein n=1 Tax=Nostoc sp. FACHB-892 TaxID=2692843 RepID=UPI001681C401|nr:ParB/RepB/Spo0J family partition protein [Nostoc sp. FACHB-892]MBD2729615.1 ParB/RepB/Spo0J family partition protein [Nostoc sp. FACHB-892]